MIASLSIYRYNAIHRKADGSCKVCLKRAKDELEEKRRIDILGTLSSDRAKFPPTYIPPVFTVQSATSVHVALDIFSLVEEEDKYEFSRFTIEYSTDPNMADVETRVIKVNNIKKNYSLTLENLTNGSFYYFQHKIGHSDIDGQTSAPEMLLVGNLYLIQMLLQPHLLKLVLKFTWIQF
jgi:hypothetical protein